MNIHEEAGSGLIKVMTELIGPHRVITLIVSIITLTIIMQHFIYFRKSVSCLPSERRQ